MDSDNKITSLLRAWNEGNEESVENLFPLVELELRRIAHAYMRRESEEHTLQTTALLNEAYIKLLNTEPPQWQNRAHFYGIAANIMRRILINYARDRVAQKRGGKDSQHVPLSEDIMTPERSSELLALDEALKRLAEFDPTKSKIVELKCFVGLTAEETGQVLGLATPTVNLYWRLAKAWLAREIRTDPGGS